MFVIEDQHSLGLTQWCRRKRVKGAEHDSQINGSRFKTSTAAWSQGKRSQGTINIMAIGKWKECSWAKT